MYVFRKEMTMYVLRMERGLPKPEIPGHSGKRPK